MLTRFTCVISMRTTFRPKLRVRDQRQRRAQQLERYEPSFSFE
jgi:hypothetical protein